jgi:AcrR family transcriptional regulator
MTWHVESPPSGSLPKRSLARSPRTERFADVEPADGRAARSHRTRRAILDAMRALHVEGDLRPTVPRIAARAGVSLRTVWQQFADREALLIEAVRRDREIQRSLVSRIDPDQPLAARVDAFVTQRTRVLEEMTPTWRAARGSSRSPTSCSATGSAGILAAVPRSVAFALELSNPATTAA